MDFKLTELQQDIAKLAKDFAEKELAPTVKERDEKAVFDRAILDKMGRRRRCWRRLPFPRCSLRRSCKS